MVKLSAYPETGQYVVNTPGSHTQRRPLVFRNLERALAKVRELAESESN